MARLISNQITTIDLTDNRSFSVNISCNLPTTQIHNASTDTYAPDWTTKNLNLVPQIFVGSKELSINTTGVEILWQRQEGTSDPTILTAGEKVSNKCLVVNKNMLASSTSGFITYICTATYDGMTTTNRMSFNLTSSGTNGANSYVHIKYGTAVPPPELLDTPNDYMGIYSGTSATAPTSYNAYRWFKIKGSDGTSVSIKDTAYCSETLTDSNIGQHLTIYSDAELTDEINITNYSNLVDGDAYIVSGYLCVYNSKNDRFICTGQIQGPKGDAGITYYTWIKYADSPTSTTLYDTPTAIVGLKYIGIAYNKVTPVSSSNYSDYTWAKFIGDDGKDAKYVIVTGNQVFKSTDAGQTYSPSTITLTATLCGGLSGYQWYKDNVVISGATSQTYRVNASDITDTATYKCVSADNYFDSITLVKVSDGNPGSAASIAFLTNENMVFLADSKGKSFSNINTCNIVAYTGNSKVTPTIGKITGVPVGMSIEVGTVTRNEIPLTITVEPNISLKAYGTISIPINSPIETTLKLQWQRSDAPKNSITLQIYAPNGYLLSSAQPSLSLKTFAYDGLNEITTDATYVWSEQIDNEWVIIESETNPNLILNKDSIMKSKSYQCAMTYLGNTYYATATVQDKSDSYKAIMCISNNVNVLSGIYYWVVYVLLYSEEYEIDPLLGPISISEPESPLSGNYWYCVNPDIPSVTLKKYNGTNWETTTDTQQYQYYWNRIDNGVASSYMGSNEKVQIISCKDFTSVATFQCNINQGQDMLTNCVMSLTDITDPIISSVTPTNVKDGQIWMQKNDDGTFLMFIWNASKEEWTPLNADTKTVVYTSKPSSYKAGDLWIVESDNVHNEYLKGTLLQAQVTSSIYSDDDWDITLSYDSDIKNMKETLNSYAQYLTIDDSGLRMGARSSTGELSPFTALFTNTELAFYEGDNKLVYLSNNTLHTKKAKVDTDIYVGRTISLQNFQWIIEENGSMSLIVDN